MCSAVASGTLFFVFAGGYGIRPYELGGSKPFPGRKHSIAPRFGYQQLTGLLALRVAPYNGIIVVDKAVGNMRTAEDVCPYNKTQMISQSFCRQKATRTCSRDFKKKEVKYGTI